MPGLPKSTLDYVQQGDKFFQWRGGEVSRLEALFDAIIALALTLIVVSVEVPSSFNELLATFRKLPAFAICFAILLMCWYYHFLFHRRYGLEDFPLVIMNAVLMFLVVFYVYPLKFLYKFLFDRQSTAITAEQMPMLMCMYSGGFIAIFGTLALMHLYAFKRRDRLGLSPNERLLTRQKIAELSVYVVFGVLSIVFAVLALPALAGLVYAFIGPVQGINGAWWGRKLDEEEVAA
ncbi:MAG TPA: hypothetical protein DDW52_26355 [Planctomycetaceae bacterium]|nr:hypothetical protein [Planctomycetaceae bacterium]